MAPYGAIFMCTYLPQMVWPHLGSLTFPAEQPVGGLVLLDGGEAAHGGLEAVVVLVVVGLGDLPQEHGAGAGLHLKVVVEALVHVDALPRRQADQGARGNGEFAAVAIQRHGVLVVDAFVGQGVVDPDEAHAAAPVDDVLGLEPVEVVGRVLTLLQVQELFGVDHGIFVGHGPVAVADGDEAQSQLVEVVLAVVGDVPAQLAVPDLIVLVALGLPFLRREVAEGRQVAVLPDAHGLHFLQCSVDLGSLHVRSSPVDRSSIRPRAAKSNPGGEGDGPFLLTAGEKEGTLAL